MKRRRPLQRHEHQQTPPSKEYNLTGPVALDHRGVAAIVSRVPGKPVSYQAISEEAMLRGLRGTGMPEGAVQYVRALYSAVREGHAAVITNDVENITGRKPVTFEDFAKRAASAWV